jgi:Tfp pilus assembly protein PilV
MKNNISGRKAPQRGQSLIELVLSAAILVLVTTGVVALMVKSLGTRNKGFDRNKASRLGALVVEELVNARNDSSVDFFGIDYSPTIDMANFSGYNYSIGYSSVNCGARACKEAVVRVGWSGTADTIVVTRLFSKY